MPLFGCFVWDLLGFRTSMMISLSPPFVTSLPPHLPSCPRPQEVGHDPVAIVHAGPGQVAKVRGPFGGAVGPAPGVAVVVAGVVHAVHVPGVVLLLGPVGLRNRQIGPGGEGGCLLLGLRWRSCGCRRLCCGGGLRWWGCGCGRLWLEWHWHLKKSEH